MPELPEVETVRQGLLRRIKTKQLEAVSIVWRKSFRGRPENLIGAKVKDARRIAKILVIDFDNGYSLVIHLKLTGQLVFKKGKDLAVGGHPEQSYEIGTPNKHTHLTYTFDDGSRLYFNDLRKFGWHRAVKTEAVEKMLGRSFSGLDVLSKDFAKEPFRQVLTMRKNRPIKEVLLDQSKIAGIGNIYASEVLYRGALMPDRLAGGLKREESDRLYRSIVSVIGRAIELGGSSPNTFVNVEGKKGRFMDVAAVYQQKTDPLGHPVKRMKQGARTTHYCPICQK